LFDFILIILAGWPAIVMSLILAVVGLLKRDHRFLVASAIVSFPFSWYLSGFPLIRSLIFLLPLLPFGSAYALRRGHEMTSWLLIIPFFLVIVLLYFVILAGNP
jgi:hypothetical protein